MPSLAGKVALVTGSSQGIGAALAVALAAEGAKVVVSDVQDCADTVRQIAEQGGEAIGVPADVTDNQSLKELVATAETALGPVDVLVNNAGWDDLKPFLQTDEEFWDRVLEVNFKGALRLTHEVLPGMIEREWGRIINIGSDAGRVGSSLESVYSGAKGGIIAFTRKLAFELGPFGVTINAIAPSLTLTERIRPHWDRRTQEAQDAEVARTPLRRVAEAADQARVICFLASSDADFVTGVTIDVTGGN